MARLLDVHDAAAYLGLTEKALRARVARRQVPHVRVGGRIYFRAGQLEAWLEAVQAVGVEEAVETMRARHGAG